MEKIIQKKLITECIRGWYILDDIMFGGQPDKYFTEHKDVLSKYNQLKKTYLKTIFEFYNKIGYKSSFNKLPDSCDKIERSARAITESLKKDLSKQFTMNSKKYCKLISEGIDISNDKLLKQRTNFLGRSLMIENFFIKKPMQVCLGTNLIKQELSIYKNCLQECVNEMLKISCNYYGKF